MKRIAFFIPFQGCGRRCVYCDQSAITGAGGDLPPDVVSSCLASQRAPVELCFFGGSFARLERKLMVSYLDTVRRAPPGSAVTFSSYPGDFAGEAGGRLLNELKKYPIGVIELGVPSLDPKVLRACGRDDDPEMIKKAIAAVRDSGFRIGAQIMTGLPRQTFESARSGVESLAAIMNTAGGNGGWDLRIYPCLVLRGTELAEMYKRGEFSPLSLEEAVRGAGELLRDAERAGFRAIRVGLLESSSLREAVVAGPYHPAFGELALSEKLALQLALENPSGPWEIGAKRISQLTGHGRRGINRLSELTGIPSEKIHSMLILSKG